MKEFLQNFFNPPRFSKQLTDKKKIVKKKKKKNGPTPIQKQLDETNDFMKYKLREFDDCVTGTERVLLAYNTIPDEATTIDRIWPTELMNKDSRIRRELSIQGKECFHCSRFDETLESYNEAILFSTGKGLGHTLARRGAFLLQTTDHLLALRDLNLALDYGCLEHELLDFLLEHHRPNCATEISIGKTLEKKYQNMYVKDKKRSQKVIKIRSVLDHFEKIKKMDADVMKKEKERNLKEIVNFIKKASEEENLDRNFEIEGVEMPKLESPNPINPTFSSSITLCRNTERGRHVMANRDISVGELICIDEPDCSILCPDKTEKITKHCLHCQNISKAPLPCEV